MGNLRETNSNCTLNYKVKHGERIQLEVLPIYLSLELKVLHVYYTVALEILKILNCYPLG